MASGRVRQLDEARVTAKSLIGQVWDLDGTIVLVLGEGMDRSRVRCLTLHDIDEVMDPITDWTVMWFSGSRSLHARRIA